MALIASIGQFTWVPVPGFGVRTPIYKGPFLHGSPVQWLMFARPAPRLPSALLTYTLTMFSAAPPFYTVTTGVAMAWRNFGTPPRPGSFSPSTDTTKAPWDAGVPVWALASPWAEFHVSTDMNCLASMYIL